MRTIRLVGNIALWAGACLGIVAGLVWGAGQLGWVQPLIVISGSMEPGINTGDLLIDRTVPTANVVVGDVVSLPSTMSHKLVTHRVVGITPSGSTWEIRMKGDDNADDDLETYIVGDKVLTPMLRIPQGGKVVSKIMEPAVAMPVLLALIALLGLSLLDEEPRKVVRRAIRRVTQRDPRVDELDLDLAAVGIDVLRLQAMDDLDLQLYALGIDVDAGTTALDPAMMDTIDNTPTVARNDLGYDDGLWDFQLPASDGIDVGRLSNGAPPTTSPHVEPNEAGRRMPARLG